MRISSILQSTLALAFALLSIGTLAQETSSDSLPAAQRRITSTTKALERARADLKRQEGQLKDAEKALAKSQKKVEDDQAKVEQARKAVEQARASADVAQRDYDQATGEIQRLYRERQPAPASKP
jgi:chromosome segregation ATPase